MSKEQIKQIKQLQQQNKQLNQKINQQSVNSDIDTHFQGKGVHSGIIQVVKTLAASRIEFNDDGSRLYHDKNGTRMHTMEGFIRSIKDIDGIEFTPNNDNRAKSKAPSNLKRSDMDIDAKLEYQELHGEAALFALPA